MLPGRHALNHTSPGMHTPVKGTKKKKNSHKGLKVPLNSGTRFLAAVVYHLGILLTCPSPKHPPGFSICGVHGILHTQYAKLRLNFKCKFGAVLVVIKLFSITEFCQWV